MIQVKAVVPCTSNADDLAFASLSDAVGVLDGMPDARVIGGHMVGLLATAFPVPDLEPRRTTDADIGVSTAIATSGDVSSRLIDLGYTQINGNRFEFDGRTIDLLVEVAGSKFRPKTFNQGQFDGSPGLDVALQLDPIEIDITIVYTGGHEERLRVRVPTVEWATVLKSYAAHSRQAAKDVSDLHHLLEIRQHHGVEAIGGWQLDSEGPIGRRLDAARTLRSITALDRRLIEADIKPERFLALVREYIATV